jgi:hypothetical protein
MKRNKRNKLEPHSSTLLPVRRRRRVVVSKVPPDEPDGEREVERFMVMGVVDM